MRIDKMNYYLDVCEAVLKRSTCIRRNYGSVIVKDDEIIATGYNGAPRGISNCCDIGSCQREELHIPHGERYELCRSVHSEANAIISAARKDMVGSIMYLVGRDSVTGELVAAEPCDMCRRLILNAGIIKVVERTADGGVEVIDVREEWIKGIE